ncbi:MAG TPA: hypothetical protein VI636_03165 [Candidatus Angelobacter sp.]
MSSEGTGADISPQEADDLLHKFITESTKVMAMFVSGAGVTASVVGLIKTSSDGDCFIRERPEVGTPLIAFNPSRAVSRKYGDTRAFPAPSVPGMRFASALVFVLPDGSQLAIFEVVEH